MQKQSRVQIYGREILDGARLRPKKRGVGTNERNSVSQTAVVTAAIPDNRTSHCARSEAELGRHGRERSRRLRRTRRKKRCELRFTDRSQPNDYYIINDSCVRIALSKQTLISCRKRADRSNLNREDQTDESTLMEEARLWLTS